MADESLHRGVELGDDKDKKRHRRRKEKKRHHHRHHKRHTATNFDFPGVVIVILDESVQRQLQIYVGEDVTAEKPWKKVRKDFIQEQVELEEPLEGYMCFVPYKQEILDFYEDEMMFGYKPDESRDYDEFYFCTTKEAEENVSEVVRHLEEKQKARLNNAINKVIYPWISLGSEAEVTENILKNTRGFYKIEFETKYPILNERVGFKFRMVQDARDGYMELLVPSRYAITNINLRRIHNAVQVAPLLRSREAQTHCGYHVNAWTQYEYICDFIKKLPKEFAQRFLDFRENREDWLCDHFFLNSNINFYTNDYMQMAKRKGFSSSDMNQNIEYMSFKDIKRCKDKMISAICWHPMWTGVVALAYADVSPRWVRKHQKYFEKQVADVVHSDNPVLIWSFKDGLSPKLVLETTSEVHCLSFCPHDENLLIGGCANGQVVLWDIKQKMNKVEEEEILTAAQQKYRLLMFSLMKWMKNTKDLSFVPITAISELSFTHATNVTEIHWSHPIFSLNKNGHFEPVPDNEVSLQFYTSSSDGSIKFWDLHQKPVMIAGDYKPQRKSRRLAKRPSALTTDVSPYRILHRKLRPHFQINIALPRSASFSPVSAVRMARPNIQYQLITPSAFKTFVISERLYYAPQIKRISQPPECEFYAATYLGDFIHGAWEGYEYISGDVFSQETGKILNVGRFHDGPILCIHEHHEFHGVYLTIGGKVMGIWHELLKNKPVMWRRSRHKYTDGQWSIINPSGFRINRSDGNREIWNMDVRSDTFYNEFAISGKVLLEGVPHPRKMEKNIIGLADDRGSFRLIYVTDAMTDTYDRMAKNFNEILENNANRILAFDEWQAEWTTKHATWIKEQREQAEAEMQRKKEEAWKRQQREEEERAREALEAAKKAAAKMRPPPGHYEEWAHEQWIVKEQDRMGNVLLSKKRLDKETLIKQQAPLKKIEVEEERKRFRQKIRVQKSEQIFNETIAMLFPDIVETKSVRKSSRITPREYSEIKAKYFSVYDDIKEECDEFIDDNPFIYEFNWGEILRENKVKRKKWDFATTFMHSERYEMEKTSREQAKKNISVLERVQDGEDEEGEEESEEVYGANVNFAYDETMNDLGSI